MLSGLHALQYMYGPVKLDWFSYIIDLFSERIEKIRSKIHRTSSRCAACKLNTVKRYNDLSNDGHKTSHIFRKKKRTS